MIECRHCGKPVVQAFDKLDGYYWTHTNSDVRECLAGGTYAEPDSWWTLRIYESQKRRSHDTTNRSISGERTSPVRRG